jgi:hypothetical protein
MTKIIDYNEREKYTYPPQTTIQLSISHQTTNCVNVSPQTTKNVNVPLKTNLKTKMTIIFFHEDKNILINIYIF